MSLFDDLYAAHALPLLFEHFGAGEAATVTYRPKQGPHVTGLEAILGAIEESEEVDENARRKSRRRFVKIATADLAAAHLDGQLQIAGEWWAIEGNPRVTGSVIEITAVQHGEIETTRTNYRD